MNMNNQPVKNQHVIPKTFLKKFCTKWEEFLCQFDKNNDNFHIQEIKKLAVERHFYTMYYERRDTGEMEPVFELEHTWGEFEKWWNDLYAKIEAKNINKEDSIKIQNFIVMMVIRSEYIKGTALWIIKTKEFEEKYIEKTQHLKIFGFSNEELLKKRDEAIEEQRYLWDLYIGLSSLFSNFMEASQMQVLYMQDESCNFITSDVLFIWNWRKGELFIPISSKIALYFTKSNQRNKIIYRKFSGKTELKKWNSKIICQAKRFVFLNENIDKNYILKLKNYSEKFPQK